MDTKNSLRQQMIASLSRLIDWSAIQVLTIRTPRDNGQSPRLEEALQFLKGPDFIPAESRPAPVEFNPDMSGVHFQFPRRARATSRKTTSFMVGSTAAQGAGGNVR